MLQVLLLVVAVLGAPPGDARVDLYTVGPGTDVFSRYGHAALCVVDTASPAGRCYNYGTAEFSTPIPLGWSVLRGRGRFWVSVAPVDRMLAFYRREDRTIWRQTLPLSPAAAAGLAKVLARDALPENRAYVYHHFVDNCATRPRDHVNAVTGGMLARWGASAYGRSYRDLVREGLATTPALALVSELFMGRAVDRVPTTYQAMFLPEVLRRGVTEGLGVAPELVYERRATDVRGDPLSGLRLLWIVGAVLGLVLAGGLLMPWRRVQAAARVTFAVIAGGAGLLFLALAIVSPVPELRWNELVVLLWPTDLLLVSARPWRAYVLVRTAVVLAAVVLVFVGVLVQPLGPVLAFVVPPLCVLAGRRLFDSRRNTA